MAEQRLGPLWPKYCCLALASQEQAVDRLGLHHHATLIAVILCDESHWALMLMRRGDDRAFVFDGLRKATIMEQARAFAVMASEKHKAKYEVVQADVALQGDAWSCAHRALCTLDAVLSQSGQESRGLGPQSWVLDCILTRPCSPCVRRRMRMMITRGSRRSRC